MSSEDGAGGLAFLRGLVARGLSGVKLVTSDCHVGLRDAIASTLPGASWQRCRTHYHRNLIMSLRGKSGRWPGGQVGHRDQTLCQVAFPDRTERHEPCRCRGCGAGLARALEVGVERRQVFDIPPIQVCVTEHQLIKRRWGCGTVTCADAPAGVDARVQYGPNVAAIVIYLYVGQFLSKDRTARALAELFATPISPGTVAAMTARAAAGLDAFTGQVREQLTKAEVAHFDETGLRAAAVGALGIDRQICPDHRARQAWR